MKSVDSNLLAHSYGKGTIAMKSSGFAIRWDDFFEGGHETGQVFGHSLPEDIVFDLIISMHKTVSHTDDL